MAELDGRLECCKCSNCGELLYSLSHYLRSREKIFHATQLSFVTELLKNVVSLILYVNSLTTALKRLKTSV